MLKELVLKNRSYRRFDEGFTIDERTLRELIDLARLSPSSINLQPLKYIISCTPDKNARIFPHLRWAQLLEGWEGPGEGERPSAYIIILGDTTIREKFGCDHGICAQSIMLGATERGLGGCMIANIDRKGLRGDLNIADHLEILLVLALGKPAERVVIEPVGEDGDTKYYRDEEGVHHVPKRSLDEIIIG
ncbi:MAG TPA: nitroreductase [Firmicutes bacterium]|nr:MAG: nitroreductase [Candidatus Coatesbacteria bacterium]HEC80211.1 nitroreductase [Bacillota bacterium]